MVCLKHMLVPIFENQKLPFDVLKITPFCSKHDEKFQIYCKKHECSCCSKCITETHKECRDIVNIDDAIHNVKTSNAMCEIEETLAEAEENLRKVRQHKQDNRSTLKEKLIEIEKEIKKARIKINNHLDQLQDNLMKPLYEVEEKENLKTCQLLSSLEIKENEIAECQENITKIKQYATDLQTFLFLKQIEREVYSKDKFLHSLVESGKQLSLSFKTNTSSIKHIMSHIKSLGEVKIETKPYDIVLIKKKAKQAQMMIQTAQSGSIEKVKLTLHKTIYTKGERIYGCCMLSDGRMAFTFYNDQTVKIFNEKGLKQFEVKLPAEPFDVVYINEDNTLAVSSGQSFNKCIVIVDLEMVQIKTKFSLDSFNYGIALKENRLIYSCGDKGIRMIDPFDKSTTKIVRDIMPDYCYTATFQDKIYHTNIKTNTVTCYDQQGDVQWAFKNGILKNPRGIDVDNNGNVYVAGSDSHNVVVISPNGKSHKEVLSKSDGLRDPIGVSLHYSGSKNQLLVANMTQKAHLFSFI